LASGGDSAIQLMADGDGATLWRKRRTEIYLYMDGLWLSLSHFPENGHISVWPYQQYTRTRHWALGRWL